MTAYYNEIDPYAAQWIRNLAAAGLVPAGDVDERSIADLSADDLAGYTQCHFFAGLGGWPYALRLARWPDDRPIWTGSCPCQPFSVAGKGAGTDDARHLWPHFFRLIRACRPAVVMGEQVAGAAGYGWLDGVCADLASENYASRGVDIPACAVDAPHIRSRLYWVATRDVADADILGQGDGRLQRGGELLRSSADTRNRDGFVADAADSGCEGRPPGHLAASIGSARGERGPQADGAAGHGPDAAGPVADADRSSTRQLPRELSGHEGQHALRRAVGDHVAAADGRGGGAGHTLADAQPLGQQGVSPSRLHGDGERGDDAARRPAGEAGMADAERSVGGGWTEVEERRPQGRVADWRPGAGGRNGTFWSDAEWLTGADGKARRAQPGIRLLAHGIPARVAKLRALGNAIVPEAAAEVIGAFMECAP